MGDLRERGMGWRVGGKNESLGTAADVEETWLPGNH
jgi:hypothetical protein